MGKKLTVICIALSLAVSLVACSQGTEDISLAEQGRPIINGLPPDQPFHDAVVSLHTRDGQYWYPNIFCSGTLIAPDVVLTAAHCLNQGNRTVITMPPEELVIFVGDAPVIWADGGGEPTDELHVVSETLIHPAYNPNQLTDDIALVRLASPSAHTTVPPLPAAIGFEPGDEGNLTLNFAGFGQTEEGTYDVKLQIDGTLDHIQSAGQIYYYQQDGGPCFGDSGGPAFVIRNDTAYVGGMTSYGDSECAVYGVSTRADAYEAFIADFVGTPAEPACEGDGDCDDGNDCTIDACQNPGTESSACTFAAVADETACGLGGICCAGTCGSPACSSNADCNDGVALTVDTCFDAGTCAATCVNTWPECGLEDGYCGEDCTFEDDPDCEEPPVCGVSGASCDSGADCCSGRCHPRHHYCK